MKRTPAVEASIIYAIALVLSFVGFLFTNNLSNAVSRSQLVAVLVLMPAWALMAIIAWLQRNKNRYAKFFGAVTAITAVAVTALVLVSLISSHGINAAQAQAQEVAKVNLYFAVVNFYISTMIAAGFTHFWIYRKRDEKPSYAPINPSLVRKPARKKK